MKKAALRVYVNSSPAKLKKPRFQKLTYARHYEKVLGIIAGNKNYDMPHRCSV
jgi:hypothetical protein